MTRLTTAADPEAAARRTAELIARGLRDALHRRGVAHLSLAGGDTPRRAYELLAGLLDDWSAVELWYGDERCVDPEDPQSNHRLVADSLLAHIQGPAPREHRILGELGPDAAAAAYSEQLHARIPPAEVSGPPALDVALLGLGEDGHTASLFPGHPEVLEDGGAFCLPVHDAPKPPPERVTLSLPVLRAARHCLLLATGAGKADAVAAVLAETGIRAAGACPPASVGPDPHVPASLLASGRLQIVIDDAAAPPQDRSPAEL